MEKLIKILTKRDGITEDEARKLVLETREELFNSRVKDCAEIIQRRLGLEADYIVDILSD